MVTAPYKWYALNISKHYHYLPRNKNRFYAVFVSNLKWINIIERIIIITCKWIINIDEVNQAFWRRFEKIDCGKKSSRPS